MWFFKLETETFEFMYTLFSKTRRSQGSAMGILFSVELIQISMFLASKFVNRS